MRHRRRAGHAITTITYEYAQVRPRLFTERGGAVLDAVYDEAIRLCTLAGAARADRITGTVHGGNDTRTAALDYLVEIDSLRKVTDPSTPTEHRVFVLI